MPSALACLPQGCRGKTPPTLATLDLPAWHGPLATPTADSGGTDRAEEGSLMLRDFWVGIQEAHWPVSA